MRLSDHKGLLAGAAIGGAHGTLSAALETYYPNHTAKTPKAQKQSVENRRRYRMIEKGLSHAFWGGMIGSSFDRMGKHSYGQGKTRSNGRSYQNVGPDAAWSAMGGTGKAPKTKAEFKRAWRETAFKYHPDRNSSPKAAEKFREASKAWENAQKSDWFSKLASITTLRMGLTKLNVSGDGIGKIAASTSTRGFAKDQTKETRRNSEGLMSYGIDNTRRQAELTPEQKAQAAVGGGTAAVLGSKLVKDNAQEMTGRTTLYHGGKANIADIVKKEGLQPRSNLKSGLSNPSVTEHVTHPSVNAASKDLVFTTTKKLQANAYANQVKAMEDAVSEGLRPTDGILKLRSNPISMLKSYFAPPNNSVAEMRVPLWKLREEGKVVRNPELDYLLNEMDNDPLRVVNPFYEAQKKAIEDTFGESGGTFSIKGGVPTEYVPGSNNYKRVNLGEVAEFARKHKGQFAKATAKTLGSAGLVAAGLKTLADAVRNNNPGQYKNEEDDEEKMAAAFTPALDRHPVLTKLSSRPIKHFKGQLNKDRWWFLSSKGNPTHPKRFKDRPMDAAPAEGDIYRPWNRAESHLHGPKGEEGIHFKGTLAQARAELKRAKAGNSILKIGSQHTQLSKEASDTDSRVLAALSAKNRLRMQADLASRYNEDDMYDADRIAENDTTDDPNELADAIRRGLLAEPVHPKTGPSMVPVGLLAGGAIGAGLGYPLSSIPKLQYAPRVMGAAGALLGGLYGYQATKDMRGAEGDRIYQKDLETHKRRLADPALIDQFSRDYVNDYFGYKNQDLVKESSTSNEIFVVGMNKNQQFLSFNKELTAEQKRKYRRETLKTMRELPKVKVADDHFMHDYRQWVVHPPSYYGIDKQASATANKTDPKKWEAAKAEAKSKMGGKHSARAMQLATQIYKKDGGGYSGAKPTSSTNSLKKWTKQDWNWTGGDKPGQGGRGVYLPKQKADNLRKSKEGKDQLAAAARKKSEATRKGEQYSSHGLAANTDLGRK